MFRDLSLCIRNLNITLKSSLVVGIEDLYTNKRKQCRFMLKATADVPFEGQENLSYLGEQWTRKPSDHMCIVYMQAAALF